VKSELWDGKFWKGDYFVWTVADKATKHIIYRISREA
jgi:hypothetical protein